MPRWILFDNTEREVLSREVDIKAAKFALSKRRLLRISYGSVALLVAAATAYYYDQLFVMGLALFWAAFVALWQIAAYGYGAIPDHEHALSAVRFYGKGRLIFAACFCTVLILGVATLMYLKARAI